MPLSTPSPEAARWEPGAHLKCRSRGWTLLAVESGTGCTALHLWPDEASSSGLTLLAPFDRFVPAARTPATRVEPPDRFLVAVRELVARCHPRGGLPTAGGSTIDLLPFQLEPALAMLAHGAPRILLADDVGLGKTVQAGIVAGEICRDRPGARVLILTPAGLRDQWGEELRRLFGLDSTVADAAWLRAFAARGVQHANPWAAPGTLIASHDFVKRPEVLHPLEEVSWDLLIVDEAHGCSRGSDRRLAVDALARRALRVLLLTATPHEDDDAELSALCEIGRLDGSEPPILLFRRSRGDVSRAIARRSQLLAIQPSDAERAMHELLAAYAAEVWREAGARGDDAARLAAIVLRKRALSSAGSLLVSVERRLALLIAPSAPAVSQRLLPLGDDTADDSEPEAALAAPGLADAGRERRLLEAIAAAARRATAEESKPRALLRLLRRIREPAIVFTEYRDTLVRLHASLDGACLPRLLLHGGLSRRERAHVQRDFNQRPGILLATDAAAEGLNLHGRCRLIVHFELPWSTARLQQRAGRVDRHGQRRRVHEIALVSRAAAERVVLAPLMRRAGRAAAGEPARHGLGAVLAERDVARLIFGDEQLLPMAAPRARAVTDPVRRITLGTEASEEVRRLLAIRDQLGGVAPKPAPQAFLSSMASGRVIGPGLLLLHLLTLRSRDDARVHAEIIALHVAAPPVPDRRLGRRGLRALVAWFSMHRHPPLRAHLAAAIADAIQRHAPGSLYAGAAMHVRRRLVAAARAGAARALVQAGLFDRPRVSREPIEPPDGRYDPGPGPSAVCVDVRLAAALHVHRP